MATKVNDFLLSLVAAISAAASLRMLTAAWNVGDPNASIWSHDAIEAASNDPYTVLRIYGGIETLTFDGARVPSVSVQADTRGFSSPDVLAQAWAVHESMLEPGGTPWLEHAITAKTLDPDDGTSVIDDDVTGQWIVWLKSATAPGVVGRDDSDRRIATSNYELEFEPVG